MKIALVTGGTGKLGGKIVIHLLKKGFDIFSVYNSSSSKAAEIQKSSRDFNRKIDFVKCDLTSCQNINELFDRFKLQYSSLDLLINCAGVFPKSDFESITEQEYDYVMSINLKSIFFLIQKFSEVMKDNSVIINFSSVGGIIPWENRSLYHISKAGVIALTHTLALELAPKVRVVSIAPGFIGEGSGDSEKMPLSKIPLRKYGRIENILQTIDFIIENDYITGITIPVDGGRLLI